MSTTPSSPAVLTSTLQALTAQQLIDYYPPPVPMGSALQQPSTDPAVFRDDGYIKRLNEQAYWHYAVDVPNRYTADRFSFACKTWEMGTVVNGTNAVKSPFLPQPPAYVVFDVAAFNQWWDQYTAKIAVAFGDHEAPALFFIKPAAVPPPPVIVAAGQPPPPPPALDGPIGSAVPNNPGVFTPSATDNFPDGYMYAGPTGVYQKHIYSNPFTAGNVRVIWIALQLTPPPTA